MAVIALTVEPLLSPNDLIHLGACDLEDRLKDAALSGWGRDDGRRLREWKALPSTSVPDLAWGMWSKAPHRCGRVLAVLLETIMPPASHPRSLAVIRLLRAPEAWESEVAAAKAAAEMMGEATDGMWAEEEVPVPAAAWAAGAVEAAEAACVDIDIGALLLRAWEEG